MRTTCFRLVQSLVSLELPERAEAYLSSFCTDFTEHADSAFVSTLRTDISNKKDKIREREEKEKGESGPSSIHSSVLTLSIHLCS